MPPSRTRTIKNKHAANKSGVANSSKKSDRIGGSSSDGVVKSRKSAKVANGKGGLPPSRQVRPVNPLDAAKLRRQNMYKKSRKYTAEELGVPKLNAITPVGVTKPRGKKGKVFVDDREGMATILAVVQAEKDGQIESKIMKVRQMEEIREARRAEAEHRETDKKGQMEEAKDELRKKRKRKASIRSIREGGDSDAEVSELASTGTKAKKARKKVAFA